MHAQPRKTRKKTQTNRLFCKKVQFSPQKRSIGCRYIAKNGIDLHQQFPSKKGSSAIFFANHDPSESHLVKGDVPCHAISSHPDQLETRCLDHQHHQHLHSLSIKNCPFQTFPRETGNNEPQNFIPSLRPFGEFKPFHPSAAVLHGSKS